MDKTVFLKKLGYNSGLIGLLIISCCLPHLSTNSKGELSPLWAGAFAFFIIHVIYSYCCFGLSGPICSCFTAIAIFCLLPCAVHLFSICDFEGSYLAYVTTVFLISFFDLYTVMEKDVDIDIFAYCFVFVAFLTVIAVVFPNGLHPVFFVGMILLILKGSMYKA